jgi:hypothetical protein
LFETEKDDRYLENSDPPEDNEEEITARTEISQEESEQNKAEDTIISEARGEKTEMDNEIPVDGGLGKKDGTEFPLPRVGELSIPAERYGMHTRVLEDPYMSEEQYETDEVIFDPDNFEYFKGVSRPGIRTLFLKTRRMVADNGKYLCSLNSFI